MSIKKYKSLNEGLEKYIKNTLNETKTLNESFLDEVNKKIAKFLPEEEPLKEDIWFDTKEEHDAYYKEKSRVDSALLNAIHESKKANKVIEEIVNTLTYDFEIYAEEFATYTDPDDRFYDEDLEDGFSDEAEETIVNSYGYSLLDAAVEVTKLALNKDDLYLAPEDDENGASDEELYIMDSIENILDEISNRFKQKTEVNLSFRFDVPSDIYDEQLRAAFRNGIL